MPYSSPQFSTVQRVEIRARKNVAFIGGFKVVPPTNHHKVEPVGSVVVLIPFSLLNDFRYSPSEVQSLFYAFPRVAPRLR